MHALEPAPFLARRRACHPKKKALWKARFPERPWEFFWIRKVPPATPCTSAVSAARIDKFVSGCHMHVLELARSWLDAVPVI